MKILRPAFRMAVNDDLVRKNPFDFRTTDAVTNDSSTREALTLAQERTYLEFVRADPHYSMYYDALYILFHTGLRISEFAGLTVSDIDMERRKITVDHQLQYDKKADHSPDYQTAVAVGRRYGVPVVLRVDAGAMAQSDMTFFRSENGVWLCEYVPLEYIELCPALDMQRK